MAAIYSLGRLPIPFGAPHAASAAIINMGSNPIASLPVTLTVSGATTFTNTQTLTNVASGDTVLVTFAGYTPTTTGMNTLTVTVPSDDNVGNNTQTWMQEVTNDAIRYADAGPSGGGVGYNTGSGIIAVRYNVTQAKDALSARIYLDGATTIGRTVYAVLLDDTGAILDQSSNLVVTAADTGSYKNFDFPTQPSVGPGDFYVGLAQTASATGYFRSGRRTRPPCG